MVKKINPWVILTGVVIGAAAVLLTALGNPGNMGFCIACFLRDIAGALGLHSAGVVQYFRPEIVGLVLGSLVMSVAAKEFKAKGGSAPVTRFVLGMFVMIGALMFLGCPLRMVIRLGGGDLNALVGLVGFIVGILVGCVCLKKGFSLKRAYNQVHCEGWLLPAEMVELIESGVNNIVCVQPFGCLPNHIVGKGPIHALRERFPSANIVPIDYDPSATKVNQENRLKLMLSVAKAEL